ncbi:hypothetical protein AB1N83_014322, partial [Pleurotus pulmonarius]
TRSSSTRSPRCRPSTTTSRPPSVTCTPSRNASGRVRARRSGCAWSAPRPNTRCARSRIWRRRMRGMSACLCHCMTGTRPRWRSTAPSTGSSPPRACQTTSCGSNIASTHPLRSISPSR